jgi:hypothetical protein
VEKPNKKEKMMKTLNFLTVAMLLFAITGTSFVLEAKNDCKYTEKSKCLHHKGSCHWKGKTKWADGGRCHTGGVSKPKDAPKDTSTPAAPSLIFNLLGDPNINMPVSFLDANKAVISSTTIATLASTPIPAGTVSIQAGPNSDATNDCDTPASLAGILVTGAQYNVTSNGNGDLVVVKQ